MEVKSTQMMAQMGTAAVAQMGEEAMKRDEDDTSLTNFMGYSMRVAGLAGGMATILCAILGLLSSITRSPVYLYIMSFGIVSVGLDIGSFCDFGLKAWIKAELKFMTLLWGKGSFYVFIGTLLLWQWGLLTVIVGVYMMIVGCLMILTSYTTARKLQSLRQRLVKKLGSDIERAFNMYDKDGSGKIDVSEFSKLANELNIDLNANTIEVAKKELDKNGDGFIDRNEFRVFLATEKASTFL
mmetsp:Transcript_10242/g.12221  ORF Transcript_10242/g.12221 Transcript_10242/m.12221 type:complete len:240 (+) Transcript_10242:48-767(+)